MAPVWTRPGPASALRAGDVQTAAGLSTTNLKSQGGGVGMTYGRQRRFRAVRVTLWPGLS